MHEPRHPPPEVTIVACANGPLLVRGDVVLQGPDGTPLEKHRNTIALCRCGASTVKPYCDGSHKLTGFRTEPDDADEAGNVGGEV